MFACNDDGNEFNDLLPEVPVNQPIFLNNPEFNALIYNNLGLAYLNINQYDLAEKTFYRGLELDSTEILIYESLGYLYYLSKNYEKSVAINLKRDTDITKIPDIGITDQRNFNQLLN